MGFEKFRHDSSDSKTSNEENNSYENVNENMEDLGLKIEDKLLKIISPEKFQQDPCNIFKILQLIGRFNLEIDKVSIPLIQETIPKLKELSKEQFGEEWKNLLLHTEQPSLGLSSGMSLGVFDEIHPEIPPLNKTDQDPKWHPEGNVWTHTLISLDAAAKIATREKLNADQAFVIILAVLCHDMGKPAVTKIINERIRSIRHEKAGIEPTKNFLDSIGIDEETISKVIPLVKNHLVPINFYNDETNRNIEVTDKAIRRLIKNIRPATIEDLILVCEADYLGSGNLDPQQRDQKTLPKIKFPAGEWLSDRVKKLIESPVELGDSKTDQASDIISGKEWISLGFESSPLIGVLIKISNELGEKKGYSREKIIGIIKGINDSEIALKELASHLK